MSRFLQRIIRPMIYKQPPVAGGGGAMTLVAEPAIGGGQPQVGISIGYTAGTWTNAVTVAASWMLDGFAVLDAVLNPTFTPAAGDVGQFLSVAEFATDSLGVTQTAVSESKMVVA